MMAKSVVMCSNLIDNSLKHVYLVDKTIIVY